jgi:hypothetical protein
VLGMNSPNQALGVPGELASLAPQGMACCSRRACMKRRSRFPGRRHGSSFDAFQSDSLDIETSFLRAGPQSTSPRLITRQSIHETVTKASEANERRAWPAKTG